MDGENKEITGVFNKFRKKKKKVAVIVVMVLSSASIELLLIVHNGKYICLPSRE